MEKRSRIHGRSHNGRPKLLNRGAKWILVNYLSIYRIKQFGDTRLTYYRSQPWPIPRRYSGVMSRLLGPGISTSDRLNEARLFRFPPLRRCPFAMATRAGTNAAAA